MMTYTEPTVEVIPMEKSDILTFSPGSISPLPGGGTGTPEVDW